MKQTTLCLVIAFAIGFGACKKKEEKKEDTPTTTQTEEKKTVVEEKTKEEERTDYKKLIQGRWVNSKDDTFWAYYDEEKVYGDGYEQGVRYQIKGDVISHPENSWEAKIVSITEKEMVLELQDGTKETWRKENLDEKSKGGEKAEKIDPKLLIGVWDIANSKIEDSSPRRYKANGKVDFIPFTDNYTYKIENGYIVYGESGDAPYEPTPNEKIVSLTKNELVLLVDGKKVRYVRQ
jgi:hypothetical protein